MQNSLQRKSWREYGGAMTGYLAFAKL